MNQVSSHWMLKLARVAKHSLPHLHSHMLTIIFPALYIHRPGEPIQPIQHPANDWGGVMKFDVPISLIYNSTPC